MTGRNSLARLFDDWEHEILRPVVVAALTACALFLGSLAFKPIRLFLFPPQELGDYPLYCTAEQYVRTEGSEPPLGINFFIINRTGKEQTRGDLEDFLKKGIQGEAKLSPVVHLQYSRSVGKVERAYQDPDFNADKGEIEILSNGAELQLVPKYIEPRAIMKISIVVVGLPTLSGVARSAKSTIPFHKLADYERACYSR